MPPHNQIGLKQNNSYFLTLN